MLFNKRILSALALTTLLASCSAMQKKHSTPKVSYDDYKGYYKVGDPYEIDGKWYYPKVQPDYDEVGISSWYGDEFHGKPTANGDTFDKNSLTAAHNTLPLPSMVRVTNLENNKTIILMINDRGPFAKGRVIDVSERAADILGFREKGIAKVRVQFLKGQTNRLLAGIKNAPSGDAPVVQEKGITSLFKKDEETLPYAIEDESFEEQEGNEPFSLSVDKNKILEPVKKLSNMLTKEPDMRTPAPVEHRGIMPEIYIAADETAEEELPETIVVKNNSVVESDLKEISDNEERLDIETIGSWQGDVNDAEIEETIEAVSAEVLKMEADKYIKLPEKEQHFVQAGTYSQVSNAYRIEKKLMPLGDVVVAPVIVGDRKLYRVRLGPIPNEKIAKIALQKVVNLGHPDAMIVKELPSLQ